MVEELFFGVLVEGEKVLGGAGEGEEGGETFGCGVLEEEGF